jgi:GNAT superfamily N-acetyltransferase
VTREERVMIEALRGFAPIAEEVGGALVTLYPEAPDSPMLNRAVGLGVDVPATEDDVDAVLAAMPAGTTFYVAVAPGARPPELQRWLGERGLEQGWGWMAFRRGVEPLAARPSNLMIREVRGDADVSTFARIVRIGYDLPEALEPVLALAPGTGWLCLLALDGDDAISAAGLFVSEGAGYLGFAATLAEHRGKGAQSLLLAERIRLAAELGCDVVLSETGELRGELPSNSYRNIVRAGFEEIAVTANWVGRA